MRRTAALGGIAVAITLIAAACGGGGGTKTTASANGAATSSSSSQAGGGGGGVSGSIEACKLSESDVSAIVGFTVTKQKGSGGNDCSFGALETDSSHLGASVTFTVTPFSGGDAEVKVVADALAKTFNTSAVDVSGLGDKAFFIDAGVVGEIIVFSGKTQVVVAVGGLEQDTSGRKSQLIALAKKLLS